MEKLSTEEKARAYDEALKVAKDIRDGKATYIPNGTTVIEAIFPELKEKEDEKIKKWLISQLKIKSDGTNSDLNIMIDKAIAWLEKQGEQTSLQTNERAWLYLVSDVLTWKDGIGQYLDDPRVQELAKKLHSEYAQKLYNSVQDAPDTDKVESQLEVGAWITFYGGCPFKILKVESELNGTLDYLLLNQNGQDSYLNKKYVDENARLWSIQDAKPGDVLVSSKNQPFIYNGWFNEGNVGAYCGLNIKGEFIISYQQCNWTTNKNIKPATQEQCNTLFQKMNEATWEWDAKSKELIRIY